MKLTAYRVSDFDCPIEPGPVKAPWMDNFASRCLPMLIADQYGWTIAVQSTAKAAWSGEPEIFATTTVGPCMSHFGNGIVTFHIPYLFKTDPGWLLYVKGPTNHLKDYIQPLEGVVETDVSAATFTMNWKFTRAGHAIWEAGDPICQIFPVPRRIDEVETEIKGINDDPLMRARYEGWRDSRSYFNASGGYNDGDWQKDYFKGRHFDGTPYDEHLTKLKLGRF